MLEILNNPWVVGIGGGVITSLITYFFTDKLFKKKVTKEVFENIKLGNSEITYAIRPLIVDKKVPRPHIIKSLIASTARKYNLDAESLLTPEQITENLVKEILDNSFLSAENKLDYANIIFEIHNNQVAEESANQPTFAELQTSVNRQEVRLSRLRDLSMILAVIAGIVTSVASVLTKESLNSKFFESTKEFDTAIFTVFIVIGAVIITVLAYSQWYVQRRRRGSDEEDRDS